jgi:hypothetical protein
MYIKKYFKNIKSLNFLSFKKKLMLNNKNKLNKLIKIKKKKKLFKKYKFFKLKKKLILNNKNRVNKRIKKKKNILKFKHRVKYNYNFIKNNINLQKCNILKIKNKFLILNNYNKLCKLKLFNIFNKNIKPNLFFNNNYIYIINNIFHSDNIFTYLFYKNYLFIILYAIFFINFFKKKIFRYKYSLRLLNNNLLIKMSNLVNKISFFNSHYMFFKITVILKKLQLEKILLKMLNKRVNIYLKNISKVLNIRRELTIPASCRIW